MVKILADRNKQARQRLAIRAIPWPELKRDIQGKIAAASINNFCHGPPLLLMVIRNVSVNTRVFVKNQGLWNSQDKFSDCHGFKSIKEQQSQAEIWLAGLWREFLQIPSNRSKLAIVKKRLCKSAVEVGGLPSVFTSISVASLAHTMRCSLCCARSQCSLLSWLIKAQLSPNRIGCCH